MKISNNIELHVNMDVGIISEERVHYLVESGVAERCDFNTIDGGWYFSGKNNELFITTFEDLKGLPDYFYIAITNYGIKITNKE